MNSIIRLKVNLLTSLLLSIGSVYTVVAQEGFVSLGWAATGSGGSSTYTIGQPFYDQISSSTGTINQGVQYPYLKKTIVTVITEEVEAYHGFNPNINGWVINNIEKHPNAIVRVFNSWGNEIWSTTGYANNGNHNQQWFGKTLLGSDVEAGVYYYVINYNNGTADPKNGWVYLNR